jgi:hypothetical protein
VSLPRLMNLVLFVVILVTGTACGGSMTSPAEHAIVGTWVSDMDQTVFIFSSGKTYVIEEPSLGRITGTYRASQNTTKLQDTQFVLEGAPYTIRFRRTNEEFIIDYGDGITSQAAFRRK